MADWHPLKLIGCIRNASFERDDKVPIAGSFVKSMTALLKYDRFSLHKMAFQQFWLDSGLKTLTFQAFFYTE